MEVSVIKIGNIKLYLSTLTLQLVVKSKRPDHVL